MRTTISPVVSAAWAAVVLASSVAAAERPNFLFILTDDQGYGDIGRHGNPILKTPHLDAFHDQSVRFSDFCVSPSCSPTRAALLSGISNLRLGVTHTMSPRCQMDLKAKILPQYLQSAGYATACIGKWHLGEGGDYAPGRRGFDYVAGKPQHYQNGRYREDILFDEAMGFMERSAGQPFFCYLATWSPHAPLIVPEKYVEPYKGKVTDEQAHFFGMIANLDENVGRMMRWLEEKNLASNTVVVLMNDNGGTYGVDVFNAGLRGCKCTAWPGGFRAFSFWRWPGRWAPRDVDALAAHVDVLPTFAALAGVTLPPPAEGMELDGHSLVPLLEGGDDPWFRDRFVFVHNTRWPGGMAADHKECLAGVRWQNYLLVRSRPCRNPECRKAAVSQCNVLLGVERGSTTAVYTKNAQFTWGVTPGEGWALYDVRKDPACETDLAATRKDVAGNMHQAYDQWWEAMYPQMIAAGGDTRVTEEDKVAPRPKRPAE